MRGCLKADKMVHTLAEQTAEMMVAWMVEMMVAEKVESTANE